MDCFPFPQTNDAKASIVPQLRGNPQRIIGVAAKHRRR